VPALPHWPGGLAPSLDLRVQNNDAVSVAGLHALQTPPQHPSPVSPHTPAHATTHTRCTPSPSPCTCLPAVQPQPRPGRPGDHLGGGGPALPSVPGGLPGPHGHPHRPQRHQRRPGHGQHLLRCLVSQPTGGTRIIGMRHSCPDLPCLTLPCPALPRPASPCPSGPPSPPRLQPGGHVAGHQQRHLSMHLMCQLPGDWPALVPHRRRHPGKQRVQARPLRCSPAACSPACYTFACVVFLAGVSSHN